MKNKQTYEKLLARIKNRDSLLIKYDEYINLVKAELDQFNATKEPRLYQVVYQNLLQRLYLSIKACRILFPEFDKNYYFRFPVATQMRVAILDSITVAYLITFIQDNTDEKLRLELARLEHPLARRTYKDIVNRSVDDREKGKMLSDLYTLFTGNFDEKATLKKIKDLRPGDMIKFINKTQLSWFTDSYFLYVYFSQYEHYSPKSKLFLESEPDIDFDKFVYATFWIFAASCLCFDALQVNPEKKKKLKDLRDSIVELPPLT